MMKYKGYIGNVEYDDENRIFSGSVINTKTVITFQGSTVDELEKAFKDYKTDGRKLSLSIPKNSVVLLRVK